MSRPNGESIYPERPQETRPAVPSFGMTMLFLAIVPPITVILWRIATMPW